MGLIGTLVGIIQTVFLRAALLPLASGGGSVSYSYSLFRLAFASGSTVFSAVAIIAGFFITVGVQYLLAKAFRGSGDFKTQGYNYLLFAVPLTLVSSVLGLIPFLGAFVSLAVAIYQIILNVFSIMAAHRLSGGKATAVVLIPIAAVILLFAVCGVVAFAVFYAALQR